MIITQAIVQALMVGFRKNYQDGLAAAESQWKKVATEVPSTGSSTTYAWLGKFPKFREWIGDRVFNNLAAHGYSLTNKKFESSAAIGRDEIEDDLAGVYAPVMKELGQSAGEHPDELVFEALKNGFSELCYDGQYFFDTDHPIYPNTDGSGTAVTVSNMQAGAADAWFLMDTSRALKPLIYQLRRKIEFHALMKPEDSEASWLRDEYQYGADGRMQAGYGFWQMAYASQMALNAANLKLADQAMIAFEGDGGKKLGIKPNTLVVGTSNKWAAKDLIDTQFLPGGGNNPFYKAYDLIVVPWL